MKTAKFYVEIEILNTLEDISNMFSFVKEKEDEMATRPESSVITPIVFTGKVKDSDGYFVTNDSPYLLGGCWPE